MVSYTLPHHLCYWRVSVSCGVYDLLWQKFDGQTILSHNSTTYWILYVTKSGPEKIFSASVLVHRLLCWWRSIRSVGSSEGGREIVIDGLRMCVFMTYLQRRQPEFPHQWNVCVKERLCFPDYIKRESKYKRLRFPFQGNGISVCLIPPRNVLISQCGTPLAAVE